MKLLPLLMEMEATLSLNIQTLAVQKWVTQSVSGLLRVYHQVQANVKSV